MLSETKYQAKLVARLVHMFPGCEIIRQDPTRTQGLPDLLILWKNNWAMLEVKASEKSPEQPNQRYYVDHFNTQSFAAFVYPENEEEVLSALQHSFGL